MFPPSEPHLSGLLPIGDGHEMYLERSGRADGSPVLYLHGGPGGGMGGGYRRMFDPDRFSIVGCDQRGCGRSRPLVIDALESLAQNHTGALIADLEALRRHLAIDRWLVCGVSWGTTLALAYAQEHPERVSAMLLGAVTTTTDEEVAWITEDVGRLFPREHAPFAAAVERAPGERIVDAYFRALTDPDPERRARAAAAWCAWEDVHVSLDPQARPEPRFADPVFRGVFATLVTHYWRNAAFLRPRPILARLDRLAKIPGLLVHGRLDVSSPLRTAYDLHARWPASRFVVIEDEGHGGPRMMRTLSEGASELFALASAEGAA